MLKSIISNENVSKSYIIVSNRITNIQIVVYWCMEKQVYTLRLDMDWKLIKLMSEIDRFDASWSAIERKEGQTLKQLKNVATVKSVGASTRIEGSAMTDEEVEVLLKNIDISKLED